MRMSIMIGAFVVVVVVVVAVAVVVVVVVVVVCVWRVFCVVFCVILHI